MQMFIPYNNELYYHSVWFGINVFWKIINFSENIFWKTVSFSGVW